MHFYFKILCGQSWIFSAMPFYGKCLIGLGDGECIHQILGFAAGYSIPCSDVLLKIPFLQLIFPRTALVFSGREWSLSRETSLTVWKALLWRKKKKKKKDFKRDKHSQSNRSRGVGLKQSGNIVWCSYSNYFDKVIEANRRYIKCFGVYLFIFINKILSCRCESPFTVCI